MRNHAAVTLRDGTGLGLFSSGPLPAGAAYSFRFYAAGTYPVIAGSARQTVGARRSARGRPPARPAATS